MNTGDIIEDLRWTEGLSNEEMFEKLDPPRNTVARLYWELEPERPTPTISEGRPLLCDRDQLQRVPRDVLEDMATVLEIPRAKHSS
eukprot:8209921-Pyramimonas_sp.AAC.1